MFPFIYNNTGITDDKVLHFIVGFITFFILKYIFKCSNKKSFFIIIYIAILKEIFDYFDPKHNTELLDIIFTIIGSFFYFFIEKIVQLFYKK